MPPSTIPSIFNAISSPDPRCENSEAMLPRNGKALSQPHDAWPVLAFGAYLLRCRDKAAPPDRKEDPTRVEGRQIDRARGSVRDQLGHRLAGSRCVEDAPDAMAGGNIGVLDTR